MSESVPCFSSRAQDSEESLNSPVISSDFQEITARSRFSLKTLTFTGVNLTRENSTPYARVFRRRTIKDNTPDARFIQICEFLRSSKTLGRITIPCSWNENSETDIPTEISAWLRYTQLPASQIDIEFTENYIASDDRAITYTLAALRDLGAGLILSGMGHSQTSLTLLRDRTFSALITGITLDRHLFMRQHSHVHSEYILAAALLGLARDLKLSTRAEGICSLETLHFLQEHGCEEGSGNLLHPSESLPEFLRRFNPPKANIAPENSGGQTANEK